MEGHQWEDPAARCVGMLLDGRARASGLHRPAMDQTALLVLNAHHDVVSFRLPEVVGGSTWHCLMDTNLPGGLEAELFGSGDEYLVTGRSVLLFALEPDEGHSIALRQATRALSRLSEAPAFVPVSSPTEGPDEGEAKLPGTGETGTGEAGI